MGSALSLSPRLRPFAWQGRHYAHMSSVPLSYLHASPPLWELLQRFRSPRQWREAFDGTPSQGDERLIRELHLVGILIDPGNPEPIHEFRGRADARATLTLYPTNSCNLRCVYCYATSGPGAGPRLSSEHALSSVDAFFEQLSPGIEAVGLNFHGGGEPTTNFAVMEAAWNRFAALASDRNLPSRVGTITNGTFGERVLRALSSPEWHVLISYDGPRQGAQRPTANDSDSRARVVANIRALAATGKRITTRATLTRDGLTSMRALVDDAAAIGIAAVQVEPAGTVGRGSNLLDGPPDPLEFAEAFLDAFRYALTCGVELTTSKWSHAQVGDGRNCGAISGMRAVTPDGYLSACTEVDDGTDPDNPFVIGRLDSVGPRLEIWPKRERNLQSRTGYALHHCSTCFMVDTCAGGCAAHALARTGDIFARDDATCVASQRVNPELMSDIADGRLMPDAGWQPRTCELASGESSVPGAHGRIVSMVPAFARRRWNMSPVRRPLFPATRDDPMFFHLPA